MKHLIGLAILCLAFGSNAFAQEMTCSHELLNQTLSADGLSEETSALLAKIEKVAGGSLTSQSFTTTLAGPAGPNGETKFYFANDSDDDTLRLHLQSMDNASITLLAESGRQQAIDLGLIKVDAPLEMAEAQLREMIAMDSFTFDAALCLADDEKSFSVQLTGVPYMPTEGFVGLLSVGPSTKKNGIVDVAGGFHNATEGANQTPTPFSNTFGRGEATEAGF